MTEKCVKSETSVPAPNVALELTEPYGYLGNNRPCWVLIPKSVSKSRFLPQKRKSRSQSRSSNSVLITVIRSNHHRLFIYVEWQFRNPHRLSLEGKALLKEKGVSYSCFGDIYTKNYSREQIKNFDFRQHTDFIQWKRMNYKKLIFYKI